MSQHEEKINKIIIEDVQHVVKWLKKEITIIIHHKEKKLT